MVDELEWPPELIQRICAEIASGKSFVEVAANDWSPSRVSIYRKMWKDEAFAAEITKAREAQQEFEADNCVEMADNATMEDWQVVKLRIWARQWRAGKLAPRKYGDKAATAETPGAPVVNVYNGLPK
jgi:hypothetical protein